MKETEFTRQFMKNVQRQEGDTFVWHKIADPVYGEATNARFVDVVCCWSGVFVALEWKLITNKQGRIDIRDVRENQIATLEQVIQAGGIGYLMIGHYRGPRDKVVYAVRPDEWRRAVARRRCKDAKSINVVEEFDYSEIVPSYKKSVLEWNINELRAEVNRVKHNL